MNNFDEIKRAWQNAGAEVKLPSAQEVLKKVKNEQKKLTRKYIFGSVALFLTVLYLLYIVIHVRFQFLSTQIGAGIIILSVIGGIVANVYMAYISSLKGPLDKDSRAYLNYLLAFRKKQRRYNGSFITIYFILLGLGFMLYLYEFLWRSMLTGIIGYTLTFGWIAFVWFFLRNRTIGKQEKRLEDMISRLQEISKQIEQE